MDSILRTTALVTNEELHWNNIAHSYEDEIFDVFKSDKDKKLPKYFNKYSNKNLIAIDLGCGIGKAFAYLHFPRSVSCLRDAAASEGSSFV